MFLFLIANSDQDGNVDAHPRAIASMTGIPLEDVTLALEQLGDPDPESRTPDEEGRRILRIGPSHWFLVNRVKYATLKDMDVIREQTRERVRRHREKRSVTLGNAPKRQVETEVKTEVQRQEHLPPNGGAWASDFEEAWRRYPHFAARSRKAEARRRWMTLRPRVAFPEVLSGLEVCRASPDWRKEGGAFVPGMQVWIKERGWETSNEPVTKSAEDW